jgi:hypothetical protein
MAAAHVLYIGPKGLVAVRETGAGEWCVTGRFELGLDSATRPSKAFVAWLARHPRDRFELVVDVLDEEQHADRIPNVSARDQRMLVRKRIESRFREAEFSLATSLKPTAQKRGRWRRDAGPSDDDGVPMLLSAIRNPAALSPWVPSLRVAERAVVSMTSPALIAPDVAKRLRPDASGLLAAVGPAGLRQTVILDGRLRFSRLTATVNGHDLDAVRTELVRTLQYLQMANVVPQERLQRGAFELWLVTDGIADATRMPSTLVLDSGVKVPVTPTSIAALQAPEVREADGSAARDAGALGLWLEPKRRARLGAAYASTSLRRFDTLARWRHAMLTAGASAIACASIGMAWVEFAAVRPADPVDVAQRHARIDAEQRRLQTRLDEHPMSGSEVAALVKVAQAVEARRVDAAALFERLSAAMPDDADLKLTELAWSRPLPGAAAGAGAGVAAAPGGGVALPPPGLGGPATGGGATARGGFVPLPPLGSGPMPMAGPGGAADPLATPLEVVLRGTVSSGLAKTEANALVERWSLALAAGCGGCTVEVRAWPYERGGGAGWTEEIAQTETRTVAFVIGMSVPPQRPTTTERIDVARR